VGRVGNLLCGRVDVCIYIYIYIYICKNMCDKSGNEYVEINHRITHGRKTIKFNSICGIKQQ
jgi:hypothetical protein